MSVQRKRKPSEGQQSPITKFFRTVPDKGSDLSRRESVEGRVLDSGSRDKVLDTSRRGPLLSNETEQQTETMETDCVSDEDDDLKTGPAFLSSMQRISVKPAPRSVWKPLAGSHSTATSASGSANLSNVSMDYYSPLGPRRDLNDRHKSKLTLDTLLAEKMRTEKLEKEMDEIHKELKEDIENGGFINICDKSEAPQVDLEFDEDQQKTLRECEVMESEIQDERPGEKVFDAARYQSLFSSTVRPNQCGFMVKAGKLIEKQVDTVTSELLMKLLTSRLLQMCFHNIVCQGALLRWLFFVMSVHDSYRTRHGCSKVLMDILFAQQRKNNGSTWAPIVNDVLAVLVNYGAEPEKLVPEEVKPGEELRQGLFQQIPQDVAVAEADQEQGYGKDNLILVLQVLAFSLQGRPKYSKEDLTILLLALCKASLDDKLKNLSAHLEFDACVCHLLKQYSEADWNSERLRLCRLLSTVTRHHHNQLHVAELLFNCRRGKFLQPRVSFLMLSGLLREDEDAAVTEEQLDTLPIRELFKFVPRIKALIKTDHYKLSSVISLLGLAVGDKDQIKSEERDDLGSLTYQVKKLVGEVRDNVSMLDRTRVKDMMVHLVISWSLEIQNMNTKQTKIFEYIHHESPQKLKIERIQTSQSCGDSESESEDENQDEHTTPPRKLARRESTGSPTNDTGEQTPVDLAEDIEDIDDVDDDRGSEPDLFQGNRNRILISDDEDDDLPEL